MRFRPSIFCLVLSAAALALADGAPRFDTGAQTDDRPALNVRPAAFDNVRIDQKLDAQLPLDLTFTDETGKTVKLGDYFTSQRPVVLCFVQYECPNLCTQVLNDLCRVMNACTLEPGQDYDLLTISFDPRETAEQAMAKKHAYVARVGRTGTYNSWHFLTGSQDAIDKVTDAAGFRYVYDAKRDQFLHAGGIMVVTPDGRMSKYFFGIGYQPNDLRLSISQARQNQVGSLSDAVLLYCYHYDPYTGKYTLAVRNLMRAGASATVLAFLGFVGVNWIRERKGRKHHDGTSGGKTL